MEMLIVIIAVVLIVLLITMKNDMSKGFQTLDDRLDGLRSEINYLKNRESESSTISSQEKKVDIPAKPIESYIPPIVPSPTKGESKDIKPVEENVIQQEKMLVEELTTGEAITVTPFQKVKTRMEALSKR